MMVSAKSISTGFSLTAATNYILFIHCNVQNLISECRCTYVCYVFILSIKLLKFCRVMQSIMLSGSLFHNLIVSEYLTLVNGSMSCLW